MKNIAKSAPAFPAANTNLFQASSHALYSKKYTSSPTVSGEEYRSNFSISKAYAEKAAARTGQNTFLGNCETVEPINQPIINDLDIDIHRNTLPVFP
jgi:hypothetical protein